MTFDVLTYQAVESDFTLAASAPAISGRPDDHGEALSDFAARLWVMLSCHIMAYVAKVKALNPKARFVRQFCAPGESSPRYIPVTLNRRLRRKLARRQRLGLMSHGAIAVHEADADDDLSHTQLLDVMIRAQKWSRVRVFGLGMTRRALRKVVFTFSGLKGDLASLRRIIACHAPLTPD